MSTDRKRIDVHHHVLPPEFKAHLAGRNQAWTGGPPVPEWDLAMAREMMAQNGIAAAVASASPSVSWGEPGTAARWARHCNELLARITHDDPTHFGGFASLPLPDTAAACRELEYAFDELHLDGVLLWASEGTQYLGDPDFEELFQELDRRKAVVFIHPNTAPPGSNVPKLTLPYALVEFVFDTTRAVANLLYSGTLERYPSIQYIVSHAGGAVPYLAWRLGLGEAMSPALRRNVPKGTLHYLQRLHYDTALSASEFVFGALRQFVPTTQILFGSDFPYVTPQLIAAEVSGLERSALLDGAAQHAIDRGNAERLFPRFRESA